MEGDAFEAAKKVAEYMHVNCLRNASIPDDPTLPADFVEQITIPLPDAIQEYLQNAQSLQFTSRGIFEQLNLVWVIVDNVLILWNYERNQLKPYSELTQAITAVALVKPRKDVFAGDVEWLLVLSTPVEVVILAILPQEDGGIEIMPTPMSVPTDNVNMLKIVGQESGRIFMLGEDANVYELQYQRNDGWFHRKCRKVNCTDSLLSVSHYIPSFLQIMPSGVKSDSVFDLLVDNDRNILYSLVDSYIQMFDLGFFGDSLRRVGSLNLSRYKVAGIAVVPVSEFSDGHLLIVTSKGERIYYTTNPASIIGEDARPEKFQFVANPTNPLQMLDQQEIDCIHYSGGFLLMSTKTTEGGQNMHLVGISRHYKLTARHFEFHDHVTQQQIPKPIHALAEIWDGSSLLGSDQSLQLISLSRRFHCLSHDFLRTLVMKRPVDHLEDILRRCDKERGMGFRGNSRRLLQGFFNHYGFEQACALCLSLACDLDPRNPVAALATEAFFEFGSSVGPKGGRNPSYASSNKPSNAVEGIILRLSLLLRPIWEHEIYRLFDIATGELVDPLEKLLDFMQQRMLTADYALDPKVAANDHPSLMALVKVITRCVEAIRLIDILRGQVDKLFVICSKLSQETRDQLDQIRFYELVANAGAAETMSKLLDAMVQHDSFKYQNLGVCPSFFSREDAILAEARKLASAALEHEDQREDRLYRSLRAFMEVVAYSRFDLKQIAEQYFKVEYYEGVVELALAGAQKTIERQEREATNGTLSPERMREHMESVQKMYLAITDTLDNIRSRQRKLAVERVRVDPRADSRPTQREEVLEQKRKDVLNIVLASKNASLHEHLYEWFVHGDERERRMDQAQPAGFATYMAQLFQINTPYLEEYLGRLSDEDEKHRDKLAEWYRAHDRHADAAEAQYRKATAASSKYPIPLKDRVDMLAPARSGHEDREKTWRIAQIQLEVLEILKRRTPPMVLSELENQLLSYVTLYKDYALKYKLWVQCLALLKYYPAAPSVIEKLWENIITEKKKIASSDAHALLFELDAVVKRFVQTDRSALDQSDRLFPLEFILNRLLITEQLPVRDVVGMLSTKVSWSALVDGLHSVIIMAKTHQAQLEELIDAQHDLMVRWLHNGPREEYAVKVQQLHARVKYLEEYIGMLKRCKNNAPTLAPLERLKREIQTSVPRGSGSYW
eukprot:TRINITY_DN7439_c0_g1_i1.p1 TRINITY_DN7439_c0_g1~~TRINITY_DN7439_c0_g1_i1.p1  ORF type:complete len:1183 (+),score=336.76 TRINITY_DN7439_c0_g1_i1:148-3696(+)